MFLITFVYLNPGAKAQECGTKSPTEAEFKAMKHYANNDRLLNVLKEHGITLPDNYFRMNG
jgi:hypothetical protein